MYSPSVLNENEAVYGMFEDEMKDDTWSSLRISDEVEKNTFEDICGNNILKKQVKVMLSEKVSYRKRVLRDLLFQCFRYDLLTSKVQNKEEKTVLLGSCK